MIRINLLPHRQLKRAERQRQFGLMAAAVAVLGLAILFIGYSYISTDINTQNSRNQRLQAAIAKLEGDIKEIDGLKEKIDVLKERIQAVESLQNNRSVAVSMMDEIARQLPEAIALKSIKQKANVITLEGTADTNGRVATLVGNLGRSKILASPQLVEIKAMPSKSPQSSTKLNNFIITVKLKAMTVPAGSKGPAKPKGGKA